MPSCEIAGQLSFTINQFPREKGDVKAFCFQLYSGGREPEHWEKLGERDLEFEQSPHCDVSPEIP